MGASRRHDRAEDRHAMSINGKQSNITDDDLLEVAARYSIGSAESIVEEIKEVFKP